MASSSDIDIKRNDTSNAAVQSSNCDGEGVATVAIVMGSQSDWPTMQHAAKILNDFDIPYRALIVSAHRTPERLYSFSKSAKANGYQIIIAGAGGAAHLPGMVASLTSLPVFGVPVQSKALSGHDSLLSIVQMPGGVPVGTLAIGDAGAKNAALLAIRVLANNNQDINLKLEQYIEAQTSSVKEIPQNI